MRILILISALCLSACAAAPSKGIDWTVWTDRAIAAGKMLDQRVDSDAPPLTAAILSTNFDKIGFTFETRTLGAQNRTGDRYKVIRKWQHPIEFALVSQPETLERIEQPFLGFMQRLGGITGHAMRQVDGPGVELLKWRSMENLEGRILLLFGTDAFYLDLARGRTPAPDAIRRFMYRWRPAASPCAGFVRHGSPSQPYTGPISTVVIAIRAEVPERLMQACIHEELAQAMGLFNDDPSVKPSLFNDDQEYGVLTLHDELLLRILYDPRLKHGMPRKVAMPIVRRIATELLAEG